jgi:hypothetical protein
MIPLLYLMGVPIRFAVPLGILCDVLNILLLVKIVRAIL